MNIEELQQQNEELKLKNETLERGLIDSQIEAHAKDLPLGTERVAKVLAHERISFDSKGNQQFIDSNGNESQFKSIGAWMDSLGVADGIPAINEQSEQTTKISKASLTEQQKADYKEVHGYPAYNALPLN